MADNNRQLWYDRIRATSKDEVILEEMQRLGFWPKDSAKPEGTEALIKRQGELQRELRGLMKEKKLYADEGLALKELRKQRMADAKQRRIETRKKIAEAQYQKACAWKERRKKELLYLGEGVSKGLNHTESHAIRLASNELPLFEDTKKLAEAMGISLAEIRFLTFTRKVAKITHYQQFKVPKKTGGERLISAPMPRLKRVQYWILDNLLNKVPLHAAAHGFRCGYSIVSNAKPHVGSELVMNCDLQNFFPTFDYVRVKGVFIALGYANQIATVLALICTEPDMREVEMDGQTYHVSSGERRLPQGAPTSPAITNIICRRLDRRLTGAARSIGFCYTRYADDMTFSGDRAAAQKLGKLKWRLKTILKDEGVTLHPDKTRIMRANNRQEVTGIVVNRKCTINRKTMKRFRAVLHHIEKDGPNGKKWRNGTNIIISIQGFVNYLAMVDPDRVKPYRDQVRRIVAKYAAKKSMTHPSALSIGQFRRNSAKGKQPREPWWIPVEAEEPALELVEQAVVKSKAKQAERITTREIVDTALQESAAQVRVPLGKPVRSKIAKVFDIIGMIVVAYFIIKLVATWPISGAIIGVIYLAYLIGRHKR